MGTALAKTTDIDTAAKQVNTAFRAGIGDAVRGFIGAGKLLVAFKAALPHGSFETMVETKLDFSPVTAWRLMKIAGHPVLSKLAHVQVLPPHWGTLAQLARVSEAKLLKAIESGAVHPGMEREDVKALLPNPKPKPKPKPEEEEEEEEEEEAKPVLLTPDQALTYAMAFVKHADSCAENLKEYMSDDPLNEVQIGVLSAAIQSLVRKWAKLAVREA